MSISALPQTRFLLWNGESEDLFVEYNSDEAARYLELDEVSDVTGMKLWEERFRELVAVGL